MKKLILLSIILIVGCATEPEPEDCAGVAGGDAVLDECGVCDSDISNDTTIFSALYGEWNKDFGSAVLSPELEKEGTDWEYKHHYEESGNSSYFSPGTKMDGSLFFN